MLRKTAFFISLMLALTAAKTIAQPSDTVLTGTWKLLSMEKHSPKGQWIPFYLPSGKPVGIIMYDDTGHMSVQITSIPRGTETPSAESEIMNGYLAYYGTYQFDPAAGTVTHHVINHINPVFSGTSLIRYIEIREGILTLTVAKEEAFRLNWMRVGTF